MPSKTPRLTLFPYTTLFRSLPAMDLTIQAMSGIMNATGFPDRPPVKAGPAVCDFLAGVHLFGGKSHTAGPRSEEHTFELQSLTNLVCRHLLEKKTDKNNVGS